MNPSRKRKFKFRYLLLILIIPVIAAGIYLNISYHESIYAKTFMTSSVDVQVTDSDYIHFKASDPNGIGFIFYPGGKVDPESYAPILFQLAERGYDCYLVKMPFNLAVFDSEAALKIVDENEDIKHWYMAGHSLGGVMASNCIYNHPDVFEGIAFFASYPMESKPLSTLKNLKSISFYGTEDGFVPFADAAAHLPLLPANQQIVKIEGGNHSQFGSYGFQKGDHLAKLNEIEQHKIIVEAIDLWLH